jgi:23S rRNA (cytidine1920-2'-O)/16S rRNA (cytidine1409-2'-O)-methyltransferase
MPKSRRRFVALVDLVDALSHDHDEAIDLIARGVVQVDGRVISNLRARVPHDAAIRVRRPRPLRGALKLTAALEHFDVQVVDRVALDIGAAAGGFTSVLVERGARRVYAVDTGFGQLRGTLRNHPRVVNLERQNLGDLDCGHVPEVVGIVTIDVSYLALTDAVPQLEHLQLSPSADLIALVKPTYELHRATAPTDPVELTRALERARTGIEASGWVVCAACPSPVPGARGTQEFLLHARRSPRSGVLVPPG